MVASHDKSTLEVKKPDKWYGVRFTQVLLLFVLVIIGYGTRAVLSDAIVAMTDNSVNPDFPSYNWTDRSVVLSSFYWGYIVPQVVSGQIAEIFGPKWFLAGSTVATGLSAIVVPFVAEFGSWAVMICRIIQGFSQAPMFPCIQYLLSKWAPLPEVSRLSAFVYAAMQLGSALCNAISGAIISSSWGWPSLFYIYGSAGILWVAAWMWLGANSPDEHTSISEEEKRYIVDSHPKSSKANSENIPTPWLEIVTSGPLLAIVFAHFVQNWGYVTFLTELPSYMNYILGFNMSSNGLLSSLPYLAMGLMSFVFGAIFDFTINKKIISKTIARKVANGIGFIGPGLILLLLGALDVSSGVAVGLLIVTLGINAAINSGFQVNHIDLSRRFSGTQMGITNTFGAASSIMAPLIVQFIVTDNTSVHQWNTVFFIAAGVYFTGSVIFSIFASGETQPWNEGAKKFRKQSEHQKKISEASVHS